MTSTPPVIFIIFNRTETAKQVFNVIRAAKPKKLFVIADGPRADTPSDADRCAATRAVIDDVDWDCEVLTNFSETNLGIRSRISSGITWAFDYVDRAIILEHDCVPSQSFFKYCAELLDRYESDERVMMISGQNHLFGQATTAESYYFSRYPHIMWGWATWRRAWSKYDVDMTLWPKIRERKLFDQYFSRRRERYYWDSVLQYIVYAGDKRGIFRPLDTWDYQWFYSMWANSGLCITPGQNLVRNVGLDSEAIHTNTRYDKIYDSLIASEIDVPLTHPENVIASSDKDQLEARLRFTYHTRGLLGAYFKYLSIKVLFSRLLQNAEKTP